jgi:hypothetical protein
MHKKWTNHSTLQTYLGRRSKAPKHLVFSLLASALLIGCGDDSSKNKTDTPECTTNDDCANHRDGKTQCTNSVCVLPGTTPQKLSCGDGHLDVGESCDKNELNDKSCTSFDGFIGGTLGCNATCEFDKSGCYQCTETDTSKCTTGQ